MRFLGTGAGEGIPNPFCICDICNNARIKGGKEQRTRSSFRIDDKVIIDIGADYFAQALMLNECFDSIEHVLYTHTHEDHFNYHMIWERFVKRAGSKKPMNIYFVDQAYRVLEEFYLTSPVTNGRELYTTPEYVNFIQLEFYQTYQIEQYKVTPLKGEHKTNIEPNSANFLIECNDHRMYYALDSGYFLDETIEYLKGIHLDLFIGECTFPCIGRDYSPHLTGHMDINQCIKNLDRLYEYNIISDQTELFLTHISAFGATHEQLVDYFKTLHKPYQITVAYDGLVIGDLFG